MPGHGRSKNGVAEPVIGPATLDRTRWLAYVPGIRIPTAVPFEDVDSRGTSPAMTHDRITQCAISTGRFAFVRMCRVVPPKIIWRSRLLV